MIVIPDVAKVDFLDWITDNWDVWIHLYVEDVALDHDTTLDDLTESTAPGYAAQQAVDWTDAEIIARRAQTQANWIKFTRDNGSPSEQVFGYYATFGETGFLLWVERMPDPPWPWASVTDVAWVLPRYTLKGESRKLRTGL